jgi:hypothetical protein
MRLLTVGDVLEWLAAAAFVVAAWLSIGPALALAVAGVALFYEAQCFEHAPLTMAGRLENEQAGPP